MIVAAVQNNVTLSGDMPTASFSIKASAAAFGILSSGLYADKNRAVIRELASNARDSHIAAGKADVPIEIKLPDWSDSTLYVKDFGTGLSKEQVMGYVTPEGRWIGGIYNTYFDSNKQDTNDLVGCFGLGSKSPFALVDAFTVESIYKGTKCVFSCYKDSSNLPAISLLSETITDEENGVTVSLLVPHDLIYDMKKAAEHTLTFFDPVPIVKGDYEHYNREYLIHGATWKLRTLDKLNYNLNRLYIVQGCVHYPVNVASLTFRMQSEVVRALAQAPLDVFVDVGVVDVAASREELTYTTKTIEALLSILQNIADEFHSQIQDQINDCGTHWERTRLFATLQDSDHGSLAKLIRLLHENKPFYDTHIVDGIETPHAISGSVPVPVKPHQQLNVFKLQSSRKCLVDVGSEYLQHHRGIDGTKLGGGIGRNVFWLVIDNHRIPRIQYYDLITATWDKYNTVLLVLKAKSKKHPITPEEIAEWKSVLPGVPVVELDKPTSTAPKPKTNKDRAFVWSGFVSSSRLTFTAACWKPEPTTPPVDALWVDMTRWGVYSPSSPSLMRSFEQLLESATICGLITKNTVIYGIPKDGNRPDIRNKYDNVFVYLKSKIMQNDMYATQLFADSLPGLATEFSRSIETHINDNWDNIVDRLGTSDLVAYWDGLRHADIMSSNWINNLKRVMALLSIKVTTTPAEVLTHHRQLINSMNAKYPLLRFIYEGQCISEMMDSIIQYANLIDKHHTTNGEE
jgi:hypothetical protein